MTSQRADGARSQGRRKRVRPGWVGRMKPLSEVEVHGIIGGILGRAVTPEEVERYRRAPIGYMRAVQGPLRDTAVQMLGEGLAPTYKQVRVRWAENARADVEASAAELGLSAEELQAEVVRCIEYAWESTGAGPEWSELAHAIELERPAVNVVLRYMRHVERTVYFTPEHRSLRVADPSGGVEANEG